MASDLMQEYARITGLSPSGAHPKRYLWTDAFAVCNYLGIFQQTHEDSFRDLALRLVDQVHHTLGRYRDDDLRAGWISGLSEQEGEDHPTRGGLRIGKSLPERETGELVEDRLEWDRDGQYYHYLTKWMHALGRVSRVSGDPRYVKWALELVKAAHARFICTPRIGGRKSMYWKMSTDLTRPLVASMGQHDPLDGFVTYLELQTIATQDFDVLHPDIHPEIADMAGICEGLSMVTDDPLGIGGLLSDATRIGELLNRGSLRHPDLLEAVLEASLSGLNSFVRSGTTDASAEYRLAFRELGLAIGLHGVSWLRQSVMQSPELFGKRLTKLLEDLTPYEPFTDCIEQFWMDPVNRKSRLWIEHREINLVMLATSLDPQGFLSI
jgi:hypothetical protein